MHLCHSQKAGGYGTQQGYGTQLPAAQSQIWPTGHMLPTPTLNFIFQINTMCIQFMANISSSMLRHLSRNVNRIIFFLTEEWMKSNVALPKNKSKSFWAAIGNVSSQHDRQVTFCNLQANIKPGGHYEQTYTHKSKHKTPCLLLAYKWTQYFMSTIPLSSAVN